LPSSIFVMPFPSTMGWPFSSRTGT